MIPALTISVAGFAPFWSRFVSPPHNWGWERERAPIVGVLLIFGLFLLIVLRAFLVIRRQRWLPTRILLNVSHFLTDNGAVILGLLIVAVVTIAIALRTEWGRTQRDRIIAGIAAVLLLIGMPVGYLSGDTSSGEVIGLIVLTLLMLAAIAAVFLWLVPREEAFSDQDAVLVVQ